MLPVFAVSIFCVLCPDVQIFADIGPLMHDILNKFHTCFIYVWVQVQPSSTVHA